MEPLILLTILFSFFLTYLILPFWIKKTKQIGLVWEDMHKVGKQKNVGGSGGTMTVFSFILGVLLYVAITTFYFHAESNTIHILALLVSFLLVSGIGLIDDLFGWQKGGMTRKTRLIFVLFAAVPLMAINAGISSMNLPFLGNVELGLLYPLLIIPLGIVGATTTYNFLAGYNGLEASQGILILGALGIATYLTGNSWLSIIALYGVATLLAFYIFNFHPAKIFPGDILTYSIGALIAIIAILGNIEKVAVIFFMPYIIETILKWRGGLVKQSFGKLKEDGSLDEPYKKIYGLEHFAIRILKKIKPSKKVYEKEVVWFINCLQIIFILIGFFGFF